MSLSYSSAFIFCASLFVAFLVSACSRPDPKAKRHEADSPSPARNFYARNLASQVRISTTDVYGAHLSDCFGTYVDKDIVAAPLSAIRNASQAKVSVLGQSGSYPVFGFTAYDFDHDVVFLRVGKRNVNFSPLDTASVSSSLAAFSVSDDGKVLMSSFRTDSLGLPLSHSQPGRALYDSLGLAHGFFVSDGRYVTARVLDSIAHRQSTRHSNIYDLHFKSDKVYVSYRNVAGIRFDTNLGSFTVHLYDDVPDYRDNFIRLVSDGYYDSLLVHRVIPGFLIQTGASDSKFARIGDEMGFLGPGYTLPMPTSQSHFHARGAVAASKLPADRNVRNRCDGGQFYVVSGRKYSPDELSKIEKEYHKHFSSQQQEVYASQGGAPHLDGDYVVFGCISDGMAVVDKISNIMVKGDDIPLQEVRILRTKIIRK